MFGMPEDSIKAKYLIKTHYIMRVIRFHPEDQTVDLIQDVYEFCNTLSGDMRLKNELGYDVTVAVQKPTVLARIPVKQERWGQFEIQCCPQEGDTGYIEVFTNDITKWMKEGGLSIPNSDRHFAKESCVFVPFVPNQKNCVTDYVTDNTKLVIKSRGAKITITDNGETSDVSIEADTMTVSAESGVSITGDVEITGKLTASEDVIADGISLVNHTHTIPAGDIATTGSATAQSNPNPVVVPAPDAQGE